MKTLSVFLVVLTSLAGCGGDDDDDPDETSLSEACDDLCECFEDDDDRDECLDDCPNLLAGQGADCYECVDDASCSELMQVGVCTNECGLEMVDGGAMGLWSIGQGAAPPYIR
jgi:hypothetical protein